MQGRDYVRRPELSIIIPVYGEGTRINRSVASLERAARHMSHEIIVVDGHPGGTTIMALGPGRAVKISSAAGRGAQMNAGAAIARGKILVFVHADTKMAEDFPHLVKNAINAGYRAGSFTFALDARGSGYRLMERWAQRRDLKTREPFGDRTHFFDAGFFRSIGGYAPIPLMEDIEIMRRIKKSGEKIKILKQKAITSARKMKAEGFIFYSVRNCLIRLFYVLGVKPPLLAKIYYGVKART